jgi:rhamnulokinase
MHHYIACDLGAESGRVMLGSLMDGKLTLEKIHRFANGPVRVNGTLRWNVLRIYDELKTGLVAVTGRHLKPDSLSCDSWGVDYVWVRGSEPMLTAPFHYRDPARNEGALERMFAIATAPEIFAETGTQFMTINTLCQLQADQQWRPWIFKSADYFLNIGDYFNFLFSGVARAEESIASTTQLYNPKKHRWSQTLQKRFCFPKKLFPKVVVSGTRLGLLSPAIAVETGLGDTQVIATCSHDTAAAVAAVPARGKGWAYLSSGTWSLLGIELEKPVITNQSRKHNFTNELGYGGCVRFLKNIIGLWLLQECRRAWAKAGRQYDYSRMTALAESAAPLQALIHPNDPRFIQPGDMPREIVAYCRETKQTAPATHGEFVRCILESLALLYRWTLDELEEITGQRLTTLHIVGGGSQNKLLNQFSANATGRTVIAGPVEATAAGNVLIQAIALGHLESLDELRRVVRRSFAVTTYKPQDAAPWQTAYERFRQLPS